jgi:hypothetical protein
VSEHWDKAVEAATDVCYENVHESGEARLRVEIAGMLRAALPHLVEAVFEDVERAIPWQSDRVGHHELDMAIVSKHSLRAYFLNAAHSLAKETP